MDFTRSDTAFCVRTQENVPCGCPLRIFSTVFFFDIIFLNSLSFFLSLYLMDIKKIKTNLYRSVSWFHIDSFLFVKINFHHMCPCVCRCTDYTLTFFACNFRKSQYFLNYLLYYGVIINMKNNSTIQYVFTSN